MKKNTAPALKTDAKPAKKLFGIATDQLSAVHGGGGVIVHQDGNPTTPPTHG